MRAGHPSLDETQTDLGVDTDGDGQRVTQPQSFVTLEASDVVGRYVVLAKVGAGGMGVVYAAYDPELDRKVALKLLAGDSRSGAQRDERRERLLREAQALAKFSHPEIVAIHDVGEHAAGVWLAMEFVDGQTLGAWASSRERSWQEVLGVMLAAGRGVAAAHTEGLIHRDLKPDNIMVGHDGRVRVMDFGLTRPQADPAPARTGSAELGSPATELLPKPLTQHGSMLGTPSYMAPEQFAEAEVTAATDQFAYCVTLWELLFGERPFAGRTLMELATAVLEGRIRAPSKRGVPSWLRKVCERGLAVDPRRRWPSMQDLLAELGRGQARARRRRIAVACGLLAATVGGALGWQQVARRDAIGRCEVEGAAITSTWNEDSRSSIEAALSGPGGATTYTTEIVGHLTPWLDAQAQAWQAARTQACLHGDERTGTEPWSADTVDRSLWCLEDRRMEFEALVAELSGTNPLVASRAVQAAAGLSPVDSCLDPSWLLRMPVPPPERRAAVQGLRTQLWRVTAAQATGNYTEGLELARASLAEAELIAWPPLTALARLRVGGLLLLTAQYDEAGVTLADAYFEAAEIGAQEVTLDAAILLIGVIGVRQSNHAVGREWGRHAKVALVEFPDPRGLREAALFGGLANLERVAGNTAESQRLFEQALAIKQRALGADHPDLALTLTNLAVVREASGDYLGARPLHEQALAIVEQNLGSEHPEAASVLNNLAENHRLTGDHAEAKRLLTRALAIKEGALGPAHPSVASSLTNLALVLEGMGATAEARPLHERALKIKQTALGPEHPEVAGILNNLAENHRLAGSYEQAVALHEQALAIKQAKLGPDHMSVGLSLTNLGVVHQSLKSLDQAKPLHERALAIFEQQLGPDHPYLSYPLLGLAEIALVEARPSDALPLAERSLRLREQASSPPAEIAGARFVVAQALWESGGSRERAIEQAEQARALLEGDAASQASIDIVAWLASHQG